MGIFDWLGNKSKDKNKDLISAAEKGHTETVEILLAKGADVNAKDRYGEEPIF